MQHSFSQGNNVMIEVRLPDKSTKAVPIRRYESWKEGAWLSVLMENNKSYFFHIPRRKASSRKTFEMRQTSVMSSFWPFASFPVCPGFFSPSFSQAYHLHSIALPTILFSPSLQGLDLSPVSGHSSLNPE